MRQFRIDEEWSKSCDRKLKKYWKTISYEGRFIFTGSEFLQKSMGIDIILQSNKDKTDITVDTKHIRQKYNKFYLEELSCSVLGREKLGWILKKEGHPNYIFYAFWTNNKCEAYIILFNPLREWFIKNKNNYPLHTNKKSINKTTGRIIPIEDIKKEIKIIERYFEL